MTSHQTELTVLSPPLPSISPFKQFKLNFFKISTASNLQGDSYVSYTLHRPKLSTLCFFYYYRHIPIIGMKIVHCFSVTVDHSPVSNRQTEDVLV